MKLRKLLALAMAAVLAVSSASVAVADGPDGLFELNGVRYGSLAEALDKVENGQTATITLQDNYTGGGAIIEGTDKNITIDLNGFTYTVGEPTVGSAGTETNGFQLLKDNTVRFKDGTIKASDYKKLKIVFQNYCDLTLENVTVDAGDAPQVQYVASNNNGFLRIEGDSNIYAPDGACAFDVYYWANSYKGGVAVTIDTTGKIVGDIEYGSDKTDSENTPTKATITIENGTIDGDLSMTDSTSLDDAGISVNGGQFTDEKWINENYTENADLIVKIEDGDMATYYAGDDSDPIPAPDESSVTIMKAVNGSATVTGEGVKVTNDTDKELTVNNQSIPIDGMVEISPAPVSPSRPGSSSDNDDGGDYFGNETWDEVKREIAKAEEGDTIKVSATGLPYFPSSVARALKGLDITLEIRKNGVTYEVNGLEIGDIDKIWYEFDELETELLTADADSEASAAEDEDKANPDTGR